MPLAIFPTVETEQGRTTIASHALEPEASGADRSESVKRRVASSATSSLPRPVSSRVTCCPHRDRIANRSPGRRRRSSRPKTAPLAPVIATIVRILRT